MPDPIGAPRAARATPAAPASANADRETGRARTSDVRKAAAEGMRRAALVTDGSFGALTFASSALQEQWPAMQRTWLDAGFKGFGVPVVAVAPSVVAKEPSVVAEEPLVVAEEPLVVEKEPSVVTGGPWEPCKGGTASTFRFEPAPGGFAAAVGDLLEHGPFVPFLAGQPRVAQHPATTGRFAAIDKEWTRLGDMSGRAAMRALRGVPIADAATRVVARIAAACTGTAPDTAGQPKGPGVRVRPSGAEGGVDAGQAVRTAADDPGRLAGAGFFFLLAGLMNHPQVRRAVAEAACSAATDAGRKAGGDGVAATWLARAAVLSDVADRNVENRASGAPGVERDPGC